jgi:hypothetical protein
MHGIEGTRIYIHTCTVRQLTRNKMRANVRPITSARMHSGSILREFLLWHVSIYFDAERISRTSSGAVASESIAPNAFYLWCVRTFADG